MKKTRFTEQQMIRILREADLAPVVEVAKKHGISDQTIYLWRRRFGKLEAVDVKRLRGSNNMAPANACNWNDLVAAYEIRTLGVRSSELCPQLLFREVIEDDTQLLRSIVK